MPLVIIDNLESFLVSSNGAMCENLKDASHSKYESTGFSLCLNLLSLFTL